MDPVSPPATGTLAASRSRPIDPEPELLPSRRLARDTLRNALASGRGPAALTGEPGVGKTALRRALEAGRKAGEPWAVVEATPGLAPRDEPIKLARELGVDPSGFGRAELLDFLHARSLDGERRTLAIDEAQNLDADGLEEVRVLSNRLGQPDGFAAILLVGQTALARRLLRVEGRALASRISAHVHLRPLGADEVGRLLATVAPGHEWPEEVVDRIQIATGGRPGLVVDRAARLEPRPVPVERAEAVVPAREAPLVGPARPPIRVEDGLIEVGWAPEVEAPLPVSPDEPSLPAREARHTVRGEERIDDHYAALQAWHEWATNQGRHPEIIAAESAPPAPARPRESEPIAENGSARVWADDEHGFAPFGRLFTRLPLENEAD
jgi:general secretion pathway protein A